MLDFYSLGLFGLFLVCFLSATILPFSSEFILATFVLSHNYSATILLFIASLGNSLGGLTNYALGFYGNKLFLKKFNSSSSFKKINLWAGKYGYWCALLAWLPMIGDPLMIALGFYKTKLIPTIYLMIFGKTIRYLVLIYFLM
jgi:membrane protein YqaA with SNARE-associated domain